MHALYTRGG